jgi:hypothetical protein
MASWERLRKNRCMPLTMKLPDALSMRQDLAVREVVGKYKEEQNEVDVW